jgi:hypothetical protein
MRRLNEIHQNNTLDNQNDRGKSITRTSALLLKLNENIKLHSMDFV